MEKIIEGTKMIEEENVIEDIKNSEKSSLNTFLSKIHKP